MTITIRISGEHAQAAAQTLTEKIGLPVGTPHGQPSAVAMKDGKAEVLIGVNSKYFNSIVAPALVPMIRLENNPAGIFSPDAVWDGRGGVLDLKAV